MPEPLGVVGAYVEPSGQTYYAVSGNGATRAAEAQLRGDDGIAVDGKVIVSMLSHDIPLPPGIRQ
jgi:hypothetical protein